MNRKPKFDQAVKDRALELRRSGMGQSAVQRKLAEEGHKVSTGWLVKVLKEAPKMPAGVPEGQGVPLLEELPERESNIDDVRRDVSRLTLVLRRMLDAAARAEVCPTCKRGAADVDAVTKIGRVLDSASKTLARIERKAPVDPNEHPDMVAAARRARVKLHDLVERIARGAA